MQPMGQKHGLWSAGRGRYAKRSSLGVYTYRSLSYRRRPRRRTGLYDYLQPSHRHPPLARRRLRTFSKQPRGIPRRLWRLQHERADHGWNRIADLFACGTPGRIRQPPESIRSPPAITLHSVLTPSTGLAIPALPPQTNLPTICLDVKIRLLQPGLQGFATGSSGDGSNKYFI